LEVLQQWLFIISFNQQVTGEECLPFCSRGAYCQGVHWVGSDASSHTVRWKWTREPWGSYY